MANALYDKAAERFAQANLNWNTINAKVVLVDTSIYTFSKTTHDFLDDIPVEARVFTSGLLTGKTSVGGSCDADDITLVAVTGPQSEALVIFEDTGNPTTSGLIAYIDTSAGLPITPNGGDMLITWSSGSDKIFKI